jgi:hypothetical protein
MKSLTTFAVISISLLFIQSCKKEYSCEGCNAGNKPPVAIAGADQVISLPKDSVLLDGSGSNDPDGTISNWLWKKISGPVSVNFKSISDAKTIVNRLVAGVYKFELKVTDDKGAVAVDTVQVVVNNPSQSNHPPVANAGPDQTITLPLSSIILDGTASADPDNNISGYIWTKISGPSIFNIANASAVQTQVINLVQGSYQFELLVSDSGGLNSKDTMKVTVLPQPTSMIWCDSTRPHIIAQLIPLGTLSQSRTGVSVVSAGNKIFFAGGYNLGPSARVDIYDISTNTWSTAQLCIGRYEIASVANGNKIFFAAGEYGDGTWPVDSVDIYDLSTNTWSVSKLSCAGHSVAAAAVGNKVFFGGGDQGFNVTPGLSRAQQVDIYDITTASWSTALLSQPRELGIAAVAVNNKIYFAGGSAFANGNYFATDRIDIYDNASGIWSTATLQEGKTFHSCIQYGNKIYWAGGRTGGLNTPIHGSCLVDKRDLNNGNSSIEYLSHSEDWFIDAGQNAVTKDNKIVFLKSGNMFDIYDPMTQTWTIGILPMNIQYPSIISVNNIIYVTNGTQVWKLDF